MTNVDEIYKKVIAFFEQSSGSSPASNPPSEKPATSPSGFGNGNLLRIACMGNPEKTVQGELLAFLRSQGCFALSEAGFRELGSSTAWPPRGADRHIDILVLGDDYLPMAAIELKHYSPHQGDIYPLHAGLVSDYDKSGHLPLIQVGVYTQVDEIALPSSGLLLQDFQYYRFLLTYVLKGRMGSVAQLARPIVAPSAIQNNFAAFSNWLKSAEIGYQQSTALCRGASEVFQIAAKQGGFYIVQGEVNYFVGLVV